MKAIIYTIIIVMITINSSIGHNIVVPRIGDTSSRFMSISQENKLGSIIYSQILGSFNLVTDPLITGYVQMLGNR